MTEKFEWIESMESTAEYLEINLYRGADLLGGIEHYTATGEFYYWTEGGTVYLTNTLARAKAGLKLLITKGEN